MDIFALNHADDKAYTLTERIYFEKTKRLHPYVGETQRNTTLYLAVCPECKNPIEIRNIGTASGINKHHTSAPYGQHYRGSFGSLPAIRDTAAYEQCSLRGIPSLSSEQTRSNDVVSHHVLRALIENAAAVHDILGKIYGVNVGPTLFKDAVRHFVTRNAFRCSGVQVNNLPYALAYWADSRSLIGQFLPEKSRIKKIANMLTLYSLSNGRVEKIEKSKAPIINYKPDFRVHCLSLRSNDSNEGVRVGRLEIRYDEFGLVKRGKNLLAEEYEYPLDEFATYAERLNAQTSERALERQGKWRQIILDVLQEEEHGLLAKLGLEHKD